MLVFLTICTILYKVHLVTAYKSVRVLYTVLEWTGFKDIFNQSII